MLPVSEAKQDGFIILGQTRLME